VGQIRISFKFQLLATVGQKKIQFFENSDIIKNMVFDLELIFQEAISRGASDIHLVVNQPPILRFDGQLEVKRETAILSREELTNIINNLLNEEQKNRFYQDRDLDLSYQLSDGHRLRINLFWEKDGPALAARIISNAVPTMSFLGMPKIAYEIIKHMQGLILVTGSTGCGKSTALAAMIDQINQERTAHIITLEDPIEFIFSSRQSIIVQRQLGTDMKSFAAALKYIMRQDPDVIMVGEMRDLETIAATITLAETGHLVLATLHTHNAAQTIDRIVDVFPPYQQTQIRTQLSNCLLAVISQQLLPGQNGGRIAAREVMINTPAIATVIRENKIAQIKTIIQTSADKGMITMEQDIERLLNNGAISQDTQDFYKTALLR
jgi:twitching motility protein PilT